MSEAKEEEQQVLGDKLPSYIHFPLAVRELASSKANCVRKLHKLFDSEIYQRLKSVEVSRVQIMREKSPWQLCNSKNGLWEKPKPPNWPYPGLSHTSLLGHSGGSACFVHIWSSHFCRNWESCFSDHPVFREIFKKIPSGEHQPPVTTAGLIARHSRRVHHKCVRGRLCIPPGKTLG